MELGAARDFACALRSLQCFRSQLREQQRQTGIVEMRVANFHYSGIQGVNDVMKRCLRISSGMNWSGPTSRLTSKILTARSLLCSSQNAQLPSHRFPSLNAIGSTVLLRISRRTGPSLLFSTTRAMATASWKSDNCLTQTFTASFKLFPRRKKAAAYSRDGLQLGQYEKVSVLTNQTAACLGAHRHF